MKAHKNQDGEMVVTLSVKDAELLKLALERATFVDTPPGRQTEILRFAEELLKEIAQLK